MKKKNCMKILFVLILVVLIIGISTSSFASLGNMKPQVNTDGTQEMLKIGGVILGTIQVIAVAIAVIMLVVIGVRYITASPTEKADVKKTMLIYVAGALLLFAGSGLLGLIQSLADDINQNVEVDRKSWFEIIF